MCELQWDALAEIFLSDKAASGAIYCLCSRVFVRSKEEKLRQLSVEVDDNSCSESEVAHKANPNFESIKHENDAELVSCYYSASHTDNLSTDEHDSVRESQPSSSRSALLIKSLQSSDSGADLSEYLKTDSEAAWQRYWALNGERIIWNSWIAKYSDYINPGFGQEGSEASRRPEVRPLQFSFEKKDAAEGVPEAKSKNQHFLLRELSGSDSYTDKLYDKLNGEVSEGWNPLSPLSIECEFEAERLITSRCGSHASSSLRTVDSLTNVTRMTVSSLDLSNSSKTSSGDSISSVSSAQSSLSSTSSEDVDDTQGYDQQWNALWKTHYEEEYLKNYQQFLQSAHSVDEHQEADKKSAVLLSKSAKLHQSSDDNELNSDAEIRRIHRKIGQLQLQHKQATRSKVLNQLQKDDDASSSYEDQNNDAQLMSSMGLPLAFGNSGSSGGKVPKSAAKKRHHESSGSEVDEMASNNRIKAAFKLMGIEMEEGPKPFLTGNVEYRMKHIRLQNRHLLFHKKIYEQPKHIRFDDEGNPIPTDEEVEPQEASTSDDFEMHQSSTDNEEFDVNRVTSPLVKSAATPVTEEAKQNRKKKRKRKLNVPVEIKENPRLRKFWQRRFSLFSKFDLGVKLDEESWYSVTPEIIAKHTAQRCKTGVIIDAFCGAGGNAIQFAFTCQKVIAIDIDPRKIELARNNAAVYGVDKKIDFVVGDFLKLADGLRGDVVFVSPPWGGLSYSNKSVYELEEHLQPVPLTELFTRLQKITPNVALFLPKNSNTFDLIKAAGPGKSVEIEQNFLNKKLVAITAYYNDLIKTI